MAKNSSIQMLESMIALIDNKKMSSQDKWEKLTSTIALSVTGLAITHGMTKKDVAIGLRKMKEAK